MSFKNTQNTTNYYDRDISKKFDLVAFNKTFEENDYVLNNRIKNLEMSPKDNITEEKTHELSIGKTVSNIKNLLFKILNEQNINLIYEDISNKYYFGIFCITLGMIILLLNLSLIS